MAVNLGSAEGKLELNISNFTSNLSLAQKQMEGANNSFTNTGEKFKSFGQGLESAGKKMTTAVTLPIAGVAAASVKLSADFEQQMSKVSAISGVTGDDLTVLSDKAREMGSNTMYSAKEAGDAFEYMALAGWGVEEMTAGIEPTLKLAAAAAMDLGQASDIVTDNMTAFGMAADGTSKVLRDGVLVEVDNVTRFTDVMATTMSKSNTDVAMLGEAFKYVAPLAGNLGYSVEDVSLALGTMANSGIKASQAGTSLRRLLLNMSRPTDSVAGAMQGLGITMFDADGKARPLRDVLNNIREVLTDSGGDMEAYRQGMSRLNGLFEDGTIDEKQYENALYSLAQQTGIVTDATKAQALATLAGATGMSGLAAIVSASEEDWNGLADAIDNANGSTEEMYEIMTDNLSGALTELSSALQEAGIEIGNLLLPKVKEIVAKFKEWVAWFQSIDDEQKMFIIKVAGVVAAIGPLIFALGKLSSAFGSMLMLPGKLSNGFGLLIGAFSGLKTNIMNVYEATMLQRAGWSAMAAETSPLGAALGSITAPMLGIAAAIAVVIAAFVSLWKNNEEFRNNMIATWEELKAKLDEAFNSIVESINSLGFEFESITEVVKAIWEGFCNFLAPAFEGVWSIITSVVGAFAEVFAGVVEIVAGLINGDWSQVWDGAKQVVQGWLDGVTGILDGFGEIIWGQIQTVAGWFGVDWSMTWDEAKQAVSDFVDGIVEWFQSIPEKIGELVDSIIQWFQSLPERLASIWEMVVTGVQNFIASAIQFFNELPGKIGEIIGRILGTIALFVVGMIAKAIELGKQFVENVIKFFKELPTKIKELVTKVIENVKQWAEDMKNKAKETGSKFLENVVQFVKELPGKVKEFLTNVITNIKQWAIDFPNKAKQGASEAKDGIVNTIKELPGKLLALGHDIVEGLWKGINNAKDWLLGKVSDFVGGVVKGFKDSFKIQSPSRVMEDEVGHWVALGISEGFTKTLPSAVSDMQGSINDSIDKLSPGQKLMVSATDFANALVALYDKIAVWFESVENRLAISITSMLEEVKRLSQVGLSFDEFAGDLDKITQAMRTRIIEAETRQRGGDGNNGRGGTVVNNFTFNTDEPIDEIGAARLLTKSYGDIAEGFVIT